ESRVLHEQHGVQPGDRVAVLGNAAKYNEVIALARRVAATDASVFITGESGSGKELIAQFIHHHSRRSSRPVVAVNCAALPETLLESEMFGHCKGAFTGAVRDKPGLLEVANGGTMFLDELIEMSKPIQAKLLRVIQDGVVRRVGSETTDAVVNVRFIAATNRDAEEAVASGALREPGADVRPEDIPCISDNGSDPELGALAEEADASDSYYEARDRLLARFDRRFLTRVVIRAGGNLSKAARMAKVDRTTFYRLMERHGLQRNLLGGTEDE